MRTPYAETLEWYRRLIAFRAAHPVLHDGSRPHVTADAGERWISFGPPGVRTVANLGAEPRAIAVGNDQWRLALASGPGADLKGSDLMLPGWTAAVLEGGG